MLYIYIFKYIILYIHTCSLPPCTSVHLNVLRHIDLFVPLWISGGSRNLKRVVLFEEACSTEDFASYT